MHPEQDSARTQRFADQLRDQVARILQFEMRDPRIGLVSVNALTLSRGLAFADIHVSALDATDAQSRQALVNTLNAAAGFIRSRLARLQSARKMPKPRFHYDDSLDRGRRLESVIDRALAGSDAANHAR